MVRKNSKRSKISTYRLYHHGTFRLGTFRQESFRHEWIITGTFWHMHHSGLQTGIFRHLNILAPVLLCRNVPVPKCPRAEMFLHPGLQCPGFALSCFDFSWPLMTSEDAQTLPALEKSSKELTVGWWCQEIGIVLTLADCPLLLLLILFYSYFDISWPPMTSVDGQTLRALWKSSKEATAGWWCHDLYLV